MLKRKERNIQRLLFHKFPVSLSFPHFFTKSALSITMDFGSYHHPQSHLDRPMSYLLLKYHFPTLPKKLLY